MFVTLNQFHYFALACSLGICCGLVYDVLYLFTGYLKSPITAGIRDFLFFPIMLVLYVHYANSFNFPSFRVYLAIASLIGFYLYLKSFHKVVAFFANKGYNFIGRSFKKLLKRKLNGRRKKGKGVLRFGGNGDSSVVIVTGHIPVSKDKNNKQAKATFVLKKGDKSS